MKLIDNRVTDTARFDELSAGEPFYFPEEDWYGIVLCHPSASGDTAVDIQTGELAHLCPNDRVVPVNAQIEIL